MTASVEQAVRLPPQHGPRECVPYNPRNREQGERNKTCPRSDRSLGHDRGTDRNRRTTTTLSPILYLFQIPTSTLSQKLQHVLSVIVIPPVIESQRRPGPKDIPYGIPEEQWPVVLARVLENHEPYRKVAADYGVSRETIRRLVRASKKLDSYQT